MKEAVFITGQSKFEIREIPLTQLPSDRHVKIKTKWVGICGSDLHSLETHFMDELHLGHEWIGEIIEIGSAVKGFAVGNYVTSTVQITCGVCESCLTLQGQCANQYSLAVKHGMLREYAFLPFTALTKIPQPCSSNATLFEILAVAENVYIQAFKDQCKDKKILIIGAGLLGLSVALVLKKNGHKPQIIETIPSRISRAHQLKLNACHLAEALLNKDLNDSFDFIVDASGDHLNSKGGWRYLDHFGRRGFKAIMLAKYLKSMDIKSDRFFSKQAQLVWIQGCTPQSLADAVTNWQHEINDLGKILISHHFSLDDINEAFATAKKREQAARVIITISG